jgi:hypothetical protein
VLFGQIAIALVNKDVTLKRQALTKLIDLFRKPENIMYAMKNVQTVFGQGTATVTFSVDSESEFSTISKAGGSTAAAGAAAATAPASSSSPALSSSTSSSATSSAASSTNNTSSKGPERQQSELKFLPVRNLGPRFPADIYDDLAETLEVWFLSLSNKFSEELRTLLVDVRYLIRFSLSPVCIFR